MFDEDAVANCSRAKRRPAAPASRGKRSEHPSQKKLPSDTKSNAETAAPLAAAKAQSPPASGSALPPAAVEPSLKPHSSSPGTEINKLPQTGLTNGNNGGRAATPAQPGSHRQEAEQPGQLSPAERLTSTKQRPGNRSLLQSPLPACRRVRMQKATGKKLHAISLEMVEEAATIHRPLQMAEGCTEQEAELHKANCQAAQPAAPEPATMEAATRCSNPATVSRKASANCSVQVAVQSENEPYEKPVCQHGDTRKQKGNKKPRGTRNRLLSARNNVKAKLRKKAASTKPTSAMTGAEVLKESSVSATNQRASEQVQSNFTSCNTSLPGVYTCRTTFNQHVLPEALLQHAGCDK